MVLTCLIIQHRFSVCLHLKKKIGLKIGPECRIVVKIEKKAEAKLEVKQFFVSCVSYAYIFIYA